MIATKTFEYSLEGISRREWVLPDAEGMYQNLFTIVEDNIRRTLAFIPEPKRGVCVQAGGCFGVWPMVYAKYFREVYTFEPHDVNWECLVQNIEGVKNIGASKMALSDTFEPVSMHYGKKVLNSYGAHYAKKDSFGGVETMRLDDFGLSWIDHIQLDVEGFELEALRGAADMISTCQPVIVLENRPLPHKPKHGAAVRWLMDQFYYEVVDTFHADVVMIPRRSKR